MDRLVYSLCKYYGEQEGRSFLEGRKLALITSCGYEIEDGAGVYEEGLRRYAQHAKMEYLGKYAVRDRGGKAHFTGDTVRDNAKAFARLVNSAVLSGQ